MEIQKPTVLDAARLAAELNLLRGRTISEAFVARGQNVIYLLLRHPELILKCVVEKRFAYIGETDVIPVSSVREAPGLAGHLITGATQLANDRVLELLLKKQDRLGRSRKKRMVLELIPNKGNVFLVDESGAIKWSLKEPHETHYSPPRALKKATVLDFDKDMLIATAEKPESISHQLYGLNERDMKTLRFDRFESVDDAVTALRNYVRKAITPGPGWLINMQNALAGFSLVKPVIDVDESVIEVESALKVYESYYGQIVELVGQKNRIEFLVGIRDRETKRQREKLVDIERSFEAAAATRNFQTFGKLLLDNIDQIQPGARVAHLKNAEDLSPEHYDIKLDPTKTVAANAQDYFKKYKKGVSALKALGHRRELAAQKLATLELLRTEVGDDADRLQLELEKLKLIARRDEGATRKPVQRRLPYKTFKASCGWDILVGRSKTDNDELTFKTAGKNDYWFHAWQAAGSHTVLRLPDKKVVPDKQTLAEAASLAAYFSKARKSSKVPVIYTQVKYVRKPRNLPPGKVIVEREKQLMVRPAKPEELGIDN